ncbi:CinA family protein [Endozoicomonas arenosclerae]|uniref:CinA family protein n=1 Tax=Endozoicomonas arenosclerae TaxID=1633495 RepID=UPI0007831310|nr:CinA family protein [Endozoicomonas arenosclerae]
MSKDFESKLKSLAVKLQAANLKVATAESCTGGWLSQVFTSIPGSSSWFEGAIISYSNAMKHKFLDVPVTLLNRYGAVSQPVVECMALGAVKNLSVPLSVSISGIAGPEGGTDEKPVGTVWIGWCFDNQVSTEVFLFPGDREQVRRQAVEAALDGLIKVVDAISR